MAVSATVTAISAPAGGPITIAFGKRTRPFNDLNHMKVVAADALTRDDLEFIALRLMLARQPAFGNPAAFVGKSVAVDFSLANWGTIS